MTNIETIQNMYEAFGRADLEGILQQLTSDVRWECEGPAELGYTGIRRGVAEVPDFFSAIAREHRDPKLEMTEFLSTADTVASFGHYEITLRTGIRVRTVVAHLFKFHDGKVTRFVNYGDTGSILKALTANTVAA